jgi:S1-C subfamily serine protease
VAGTSGKDVKIFNRTTGEEISGKLNLGDETISNVQRVFFTPGGKHLMVDCIGSDKRRRFHSFPLVLTKEEMAMVGKPVRYAGPSAVADASLSTGVTAGTAALVEIPHKPPLSSLRMLTARSESPMSTQAVHEKYASAIVVLKSDAQSGSGFFITSDGYILTCAHVIPKLSGFTVSYREPGPSVTTFTEKTAVPVVVAIDTTQDLAILKIETSKPVNYVRTERSNVLAGGEDVTTIGNPGLGGQILDYTITKGIVSNPARILDGQTYIQTTAAVNPGSSGSPLFNSKGNVIGLVVLKANIENTGFAIPISSIYKFLADNADKDK